MVDKLFLMLPEFNVHYYNKKAALKEYKKQLKALNKEASFEEGFEVSTESDVEASSTEDVLALDEDLINQIDFKDKGFNKWLKEGEGQSFMYRDGLGRPAPKLSKVKYKTTDPTQLNVRLRNNMILDISRAILTNPTISTHFNSPGNFDTIKSEGRKSAIMTDPVMVKALALMGYYGLEAVKYLDSLDEKKLGEFINKYSEPRSLISPDTFTYFHKLNMAGKQLIGIYAINTTSLAKTLHKIAMTSRIFTLNNRKFWDITSDLVQMADGSYMRISQNCAEASAASVDNAKDPVLADLMQNTNTAGDFGAMLKMGFSIQEAGAFFVSPIIREFIKYRGKDWKNGLRKSPLTDSYDVPTLKKLGILKDGMNWDTDVLRSNTIRATEYGITPLIINAVLSYKLHPNGTMYSKVTARNEKEFVDEFLKNTTYYSESFTAEEAAEYLDMIYNISATIQAYTAFFTTEILPTTLDINSVVLISRADSPSGGISNTEAGLVKLYMSVEGVARYSEATMNVYINGNWVTVPIATVQGLGNMMPHNNVVNPRMTKDLMREAFMTSPMPMLQAFYSLGIDLPRQVISQFYAPLSAYSLDLVRRLFESNTMYNIDEKIIDKFLKGLMQVILSKSPMLGNDGEFTFKQKREWYLRNFPGEFMKIRMENPDIANNNFIKLLTIRQSSGELVFEGASTISKVARLMAMRDLESLLYSNNPEAHRLVQDLFIYSYYKDGLNFSPRGFGSFFSPMLINSIPIIANAIREAQYYLRNSPEILENYYTLFIALHADLLNVKEIKDPEDGTMISIKNANGSIPSVVQFDEKMVKLHRILKISPLVRVEEGLLMLINGLNGTYKFIPNVRLAYPVYDSNITLDEMLVEYAEEIKQYEKKEITEEGSIEDEIADYLADMVGSRADLEFNVADFSEDASKLNRQATVEYEEMYDEDQKPCPKP